MFKKNKLSIGVAAGLLGAMAMMTSAQAVHINKDGTGQVLLFPYYNAQEGYVTNVNIVNSTDETKAVRIRFREGRNSEDVMDFNLYMSPNDVWSGSIQNNGAGLAKISTSDKTCTMPARIAPTCTKGGICEPSSEEFMTGDAANGATNDDTLEGYIEVIEMGVVEDETVKAGVLHSNGSPSDCSTVSKAWETNTGEFWAGNGISEPTGGLFGSSAVLNVGEGTAFAVDPVAIENYSDKAQHTDPNDIHFLFPSLASGSVKESSVMKNNGEELIVTGWNSTNDDCDVEQDDYCANNPYPISHVLLAPHLMNEYFLDPSQGYDGHTDWVTTFPMKKHGVFNGDNDARVHFENGIFDREESRLVLEGVSPSSPEILKREVNVISFVTSDGAYDNTRTVFSSPTTTKVGVGDYVHGWARMSFGSPDSNQTISYDIGDNIEWGKRYGPYVQDENVSPDDSTYSGVPAIGFAALEGNVSENANARFGDALPHKVQRDDDH